MRPQTRRFGFVDFDAMGSAVAGNLDPTDEIVIRQNGGDNVVALVSQLPASAVPDPLLLGDGLVGAPTYSFLADPDTGGFSVGADQYGITAGGVLVATFSEAGGAVQMILPGADTPAAPTLQIGSVAQGFIDIAAGDSFAAVLDGATEYVFGFDGFHGFSATSGWLFNRAASSVSPTVGPNKDDLNTGLGQGAVDQLSLIAGGVEIAQAKEVVGANQFIVAPGLVDNNPGFPSLAFGAGGSGFYSIPTDVIGVSLVGFKRWEFNIDRFQGNNATGPAIVNRAATAFIPTLLPDRSDDNTGWAHQSADRMNAVVGGAICNEMREASNHIILFDELHTGITASVTQTQGNTPLLSSYNEVTVVANPNDVVTLPGATIGERCMVIDSGANILQIFPASGDNLGEGVDTSMTLAAGRSITFRGLDTTNWVVASFGGPGAGIPDPLLLSNGTVGAPTYSFASDPDTGIFRVTTDQMALVAGGLSCMSVSEVGGARRVGFYDGSPVALQTGVAVTTAAIHAALVNLRLFTA